MKTEIVDQNQRKRLSIELSMITYNELQEIVNNRKYQMAEIFRLGLALVKIAFDELKNENKLVITDKDGTPLKEIILPI